MQWIYSPHNGTCVALFLFLTCAAHGGAETIQVVQGSLPVIPPVRLWMIPDGNPLPALSSRCSTEDGGLM